MIRKIAVAKLRPGMVVAHLDDQMWEHQPFLYTVPGPVRTKEEIQSILERGFRETFIEVQDEEADGRVMSPEESVARHLDAEHMASPASRCGLLEEVGRAERLYARSLELARRLVQDVTEGRTMDLESAKSLVDELIDSVIRNHETLACLAKLDTFDNYTYSHSVNVSALAVVFGRFLDLDRNALTVLGLAGLFHDLGKARVDPAILNKPARLTEEEFAEMRLHPVFSRDILEEQGVEEPIVRAAAEHHEKYNGSGYPDGLASRAVSPLSRVLAMVDVFDALTSRRPYKEGMLPNQALSVMYGMRGQDFAPRDLDLFIKCLGVYPVGSLVRLTSGDYAVVVHNRPDNLLKPVILYVVASDSTARGQVDLAEDPLDDEGLPLRIEACLDPRTMDLDPKIALGVTLRPRLS